MRRRLCLILTAPSSFGRLAVLLVLAGLGFLGGVRLARGAAFAVPAVLVDPGHGGVDGGCGKRGVLLEKDLNLQVGLALAARLERFGLRVGMSRRDDRHLGPTHRRDLLARVAAARSMRASVVVSLHADWSWNSTRSGPCVFYHHDSGPGVTLARMIQEELNRVSGTRGQALPARNLLVPREAGGAAVLVEMGFLSNRTEAGRLADPAYQKLLADAVCTGVVRYLLAAA